MSTDPNRFHPLFERWARRVRGRLALRHALTGAAIGMLLATIPAAIAWKTRHGTLRPLTPLIGIVGAGAGLAFARRKRWSDTDVALYLDDRLDTDETITTAVGMRNESELDDPTRAVVVTNAAAALTKGDAKKVRPRLLRPVHALVPLALAGIVAIALAPLPPMPVAVAAPGTTKVQLQQVEGLKKVIALGQITPRDEEQRKRLEQLAKDAEKLRQDLEKGLEKREAQDRIAKLRDQIAADRLSLGDGEQRAGMEAAQQKLQESDLTKGAAKALGDHDLEALDKEMEKLANEREKGDRERAKKQLQDAAEEARRNGAPQVGKALDDAAKKLDERGKRADKLRELQKGLEGAGLGNDELRTQSEALDKSGSDKDAKKLADAMEKALEKMTPEERKRLAEKLRERAAQKGVSPGEAQDLKDLADKLSTPEGQKQLEQELRDLANEDLESDEAKRQQQLDDAQNGADDTEKDIDKHGQQGQQGQGQQGQGEQGQQQQGQGQQGQGQQGQRQQGQGQQGQGQQGQGDNPGQQGQGQGHVPIPIPMPGNGNGNQNGNNNGNGQQQGGGPSSGHDTGGGAHGGNTAPVPNAGTMKSRARGPINKAQSMPGTQTGTVPGRAGGTAKVQGTGGLKAAGPGEVDGVDQSDVPQEYRDQVKQYFQP